MASKATDNNWDQLYQKIESFEKQLIVILSQRPKLIKLQTQQDKLNRQLENIRSELRYQVGDTLVNSLYHPQQLPVLPVKLGKLFMTGLKNIKHRSKDDNANFDNAVTNHHQSLTSAANIDAHILELLKELKTLKKEVGNLHNTYYSQAHANLHPKSTYTVACILDEFSMDIFRPELHLIPLSRSSWENELSSNHIDFLLVESAWKGNQEQWSTHIANLPDKPDSLLPAIVKKCNQLSIPTVFWNKEDPPGFETFKHAAMLFDYIFTTDSDCVAKYTSLVKHTNVFPLPFAIQPLIHNPILNQPRYKNIGFAGSWFNEKHSKRKNELETLLDSALPFGLDIYDRHYYHHNRHAFAFPEKFAKNIIGSLPYTDVIASYKRYKAFVNINTVVHSPTMFSRRVLELMACGTYIISNPAMGMNKFFNTDLFTASHDKAELQSALHMILEQHNYRAKITHLAYRQVMKHHTVADRLELIGKQLGITSHTKHQQPLVSCIVLATSSKAQQMLKKQFNEQTYQAKELIFNQETKKKQAPSIAELIQQTRGDYICIMHQNYCYGPHFLEDVLLATKYATCQLLGKACHFEYYTSHQTLVLNESAREHTYSNHLHFGSLLIPKQLLKKYPINDGTTMKAWYNNCINQGVVGYSTDRFNFCCINGSRHNMDTSRLIENNQTLVSFTSQWQPIVEI